MRQSIQVDSDVDVQEIITKAQLIVNAPQAFGQKYVDEAVQQTRDAATQEAMVLIEQAQHILNNPNADAFRINYVEEAVERTRDAATQEAMGLIAQGKGTNADGDRYVTHAVELTTAEATQEASQMIEQAQNILHNPNAFGNNYVTQALAGTRDADVAAATQEATQMIEQAQLIVNNQPAFINKYLTALFEEKMADIVFKRDMDTLFHAIYTYVHFMVNAVVNNIFNDSLPLFNFLPQPVKHMREHKWAMEQQGKILSISNLSRSGKMRAGRSNPHKKTHRKKYTHHKKNNKTQRHKKRGTHKTHHHKKRGTYKKRHS